MLGFQIVASFFILMILFSAGSRFSKRDLSLRGMSVWGLFWILGLFLIWYPDSSSFLANRLGIGRGADLMIYISIGALFFVFFRMSMRLEKLEKEISFLVRENAKQYGRKNPEEKEQKTK